MHTEIDAGHRHRVGADSRSGGKLQKSMKVRSGRPEASAGPAEILVTKPRTCRYRCSRGSGRLKEGMFAIVKGKPVGRRGRKATGLKGFTPKDSGAAKSGSRSAAAQPLEVRMSSAPVIWSDRQLHGDHVTPLETHAARVRNARGRRTRAVRCRLHNGFGGAHWLR